MKKNRFKQIGCIFVAFTMIATTPVFASNKTENKESPVAEYFSDEYINPEYEKWENNGRQGEKPPLQDMSYLYESYADMPVTYDVLPEKYDLRDYGLVEPVYDQFDYGICWAVSANACAASPLLSQFPHLSFSPFHTAWFTYRGNEEEEAEYYDDPFGCGGFSSSAVATLAAWKGPVFNDSVTSNPYAEGNPAESMRFAADFHLQDSYYMPAGTQDEAEYYGGNRDITKKIIMETGPVSVKFKSDDNCFNSETNAWYNKNKDYSDHQVIVVGWDDNYSRNNFLEGNRPKKNGAWLVRNSWGTSWGDDGYFWLSYEDKTIGISSALVLEENDNYAKNYQYDTLGWVYSIVPDKKGGENKSGTAGNIFKAESDEMIEAVSFYTTDAGTEYDVKVYTGVKKGKPESGKLITTQEGVEPFSGYHTIELDQPVKIKKGENFSIVVSFYNTEFPCAIPVEMRTYYESTPPEYMGKGGESYIISNGKWKDVAGNADEFYITNVCIKAFTNPLPESMEAVSTVRFSKKAGPVKDGEEIELNANSADEIYYSLNGTDYMLYEGPFKLNLEEKDSSVTVSAYAVKNGAKGNLAEKKYTKAYAELSDFAVSYGWIRDHFNTEEKDTKYIFLDEFSDEVSLMAQSTDEIFINGEKADSSEWTDSVKVPKGEEKSFDITVKGQGKEESKYSLIAYGEILTIDFIKETITFDDSKYTITDPSGKVLKSGDSVSEYADSLYGVELKIKAESGGETTFYLPGRNFVSDIRINYKNETTFYKIDSAYRYSENPDMSDSHMGENKKIRLEPGKDLYFDLPATVNSFCSEVYHLVVPDRQKAPEVIAEKITTNSVKLKKYNNALYSIDGENWQNKPLFNNLDSDTEYTFYVYKKATNKAFASEIEENTIKTMKAAKTVGNTDNDNDREDPETGDNTLLYMWAALLITSLFELIVILKLKKLKKEEK